MARGAMIVGEVFEGLEICVPYHPVRAAGPDVIVVGTERGRTLEGKRNEEKVIPDRSIDEISGGDVDALVIPGGYSPDHLRTNDKMVKLTRDVFEAGKPVAAVCHAGWMLAEA